MEKNFLEKLIEISEEEKEILKSANAIKKSIYTSSRTFVVEYENLLNEKPIDVRVHTRFVDFPMHSHNYMEIMYVYSGRIWHNINNRDLLLEEGDILFMNRHVSHSVKRAEIDDVGINFILSDNFLNSVFNKLKNDYILQQFLVENFKYNGKPEYLHFKVGKVYPITNLIDNLLYLLFSQKEQSSLLLPDTVTLLLKHVSLNLNTLSNNEYSLSKEQLLKRQISIYISDNYKTATLSELAQKLGFSQEYLSRLILKIFGKNFKTLLLEQRMSVAEKLLLTTSMSIGDIVSAIGYENKSYFHRTFYALHQKTPLTWRQIHKKS